MIESWHVREALRDRFGSLLVDSPGFGDCAAGILRAYAPYKDSYASLSLKLQDALFNTLYEHLGPGMTVQMNNGMTRRVLISELRDAADDVLGILFDTLKPYSVNYDLLHAYWMDTGSLAAMRVLYQRFTVFLPVSERRMIENIVRENYPPSRLESWIDSVSE